MIRRRLAVKTSSFKPGYGRPRRASGAKSVFLAICRRVECRTAKVVILVILGFLGFRASRRFPRDAARSLAARHRLPRVLPCPTRAILPCPVPTLGTHPGYTPRVHHAAPGVTYHRTLLVDEQQTAAWAQRLPAAWVKRVLRLPGLRVVTALRGGGTGGSPGPGARIG